MNILNRLLIRLGMACDHEWKFEKEYDTYDQNWACITGLYRQRKYLCKWCAGIKCENVFKYTKNRPPPEPPL